MSMANTGSLMLFMDRPRSFSSVERSSPGDVDRFGMVKDAIEVGQQREFVQRDQPFGDQLWESTGKAGHNLNALQSLAGQPLPGFTVRKT